MVIIKPSRLSIRFEKILKIPITTQQGSSLLRYCMRVGRLLVVIVEDLEILIRQKSERERQEESDKVAQI